MKVGVIHGGRHVLARIAVAGALMGSMVVVGLASTASAAPPYHLVITTPSSTTDASGAPLAVQPVVSIEDSGNVVQSGDNTTVTATITSGGVSVTNGTATASSGVATFSGLALNALAGNYTLTFSDGSYATAVSATITVTAGAATKLVLTTAPSSGAVSGVALVHQPVVTAEDSGGNVATSAIPVSSTATIATGVGGTVSTGGTANFTAGVATFSGLTLTGTSGNPYTLQFSGTPLPFILSGTITMSTAATQMVLTTAPASSGFSGQALAPVPVVTIEDATNHTVVADNSSVVANITVGGISVSNATATVTNGVATFTGLALNALAGSYTLTFHDGSLPSIVSGSIVVATGPAAKLAITTQPSNAVASGAALAQQPVVIVEDSGGNLVTTNGSTVLASLTSGSGTLVNATKAAFNGIATFSGLTLNTPAGLYTLTFTDGALTAAVSSSITVGAGAASQLVIITQPSSTAVSGVALVQQPVVKVEDAGGNAITGNSSVVTAAITSGGTNTVLSNTASVSPSTGVATFSGLALRATIGTYTLTFTDGSLTAAVSGSINVGVGAATQLVIVTQPSITTPSGAVLVVQPVVKVEDAAGNVVTTDTSVVTANITTGGVSATNNLKAAVAGVASFSALTLNALVGSYTLTFTDGTLTPVVSSSIAVTTGAAAKMVVAVEPSTIATSGVALGQQPVVKVEDSGGNVVTSLSTGAATAAIYSGVGGAVSAGSSANFASGVATFSGLTLTGVSGSSYTLIYSGDSLSTIDATSIKVATAQATLTVTSSTAIWGRTLTLSATGGSGTGALSFAVTGGSATGCSITGTTLSYGSVGTCIVTATKAGDSTYSVVSSAPTTITINRLAVPGVVRVTFAANKSALTAAGRNAIVALSRKLTVKSAVTVTGYAKGNLVLARARAAVVAQFLASRIHVHINRAYVTSSPLSAAQIKTLHQ